MMRAFRGSALEVLTPPSWHDGFMSEMTNFPHFMTQPRAAFWFGSSIDARREAASACRYLPTL
jgi:hypothetical protein